MSIINQTLRGAFVKHFLKKADKDRVFIDGHDITDNLLNYPYIDETSSKKSSATSFFKGIGYKRIAIRSDVIDAVYAVYNSGIFLAQKSKKYKCNRKLAEFPKMRLLLDEIGNKIYEYLNYTPNKIDSQEEFDKYHEELCSLFLYGDTSKGIKGFNDVRRDVNPTKYSGSICYGSAQKIINMVFKYLTCYSDYLAYSSYFEFCHMPIDRFVLKGLEVFYHFNEKKRYSKTDGIKITSPNKDSFGAQYSNQAWSNMDKM